MIIKILFHLIGAIIMIATISVIFLLYHAMTQEMWKDITREEFEERYNRDFEFRWKNQDIRIHAQFVITDETRKGDEACPITTQRITDTARIA